MCALHGVFKTVLSKVVSISTLWWVSSVKLFIETTQILCLARASVFFSVDHTHCMGAH